MDRLEIRPIRNMADAQAIRVIRNSGRGFMTHDTHEITELEQALWYRRDYADANRHDDLFAFIGRLDDTPAAYGMIQFKDDYPWLTGIIAPEMRGKGFGEQLFRYLGNYALSMADKVYLDVLAGNHPARRLYEKLDYQYVDPSQEFGVMVMVKAEGEINVQQIGQE